MDKQAIIKTIMDRKGEIEQKLGIDAGRIVTQHLVDVVKILFDIATIEARRLSGGYTKEKAEDIQHLTAQLMQHLDVLINVTPMESLAWLLSLALEIAALI